MSFRRLAAVLVITLGVAHAQPRVPLTNTYERLICVVPMVGSGTAQDPRRPLYAPVRGATLAGEGIIGYAAQISDDGKSAVVEFVARDRSAFEQILNENRADVKVFVKGRAKKADIERELRQYKKDFNLDTFGVAVP